MRLIALELWHLKLLAFLLDILFFPSNQLNYISKDGEEGYPGNLKIQVVYTLTVNNSIKIDNEYLHQHITKQYINLIEKISR